MEVNIKGLDDNEVWESKNGMNVKFIKEKINFMKEYKKYKLY